jgi:hypothetical protein
LDANLALGAIAPVDWPVGATDPGVPETAHLGALVDVVVFAAGVAPVGVEVDAHIGLELSAHVGLAATGPALRSDCAVGLAPRQTGVATKGAPGRAAFTHGAALTHGAARASDAAATHRAAGFIDAAVAGTAIAVFGVVDTAHWK